MQLRHLLAALLLVVGIGVVPAAVQLDVKCCKPAPAAGVNYWSKKLGAVNLTDESYVTSLLVDSTSNIYMGGRFDGSTNLGGGVVASGVGNDIFVAKYTSNGTYVWMKHWNTGTINVHLQKMAFDGAGNIVAVGSFFQTLNFGAPCSPLVAVSSESFVVKLSATDGTCVWARNFTSNNEDVAAAVAVDASGNVLVAGAFKGTVDFGNGVSLIADAGAASDIYLLKLNSSGVAQWASGYAGDNTQGVFDLATDSSSNVVMTGSWKGTLNLGAGAVTTANNAISGPSNDAFVAMYDSSGVNVWVKTFGEVQGGEQIGQAVRFDSGDSVLVAGQAAGTVDFGGGAVTAEGTTSPDLFVLKLDSTGALGWVHRYGVPGGYDQYAYALAVDVSDNVLVAARTSGGVDLGVGAVANPDGGSGRTNALLLKLTAAGVYRWARSAGDQWSQTARAVASNGDRAVFAGVFASTIDVGTGTLTSPGNSTDTIFLGRFGP